MDAIALSSTRRSPGGKGVARRLRAEGRLPAVLYGHGVESPTPLSLDPKEFVKAITNPKGLNAVYSVEIDGTSHQVLAREMQRHPVSRKILHVDLVAADPEKLITTFVPVTFTGKSVGVVTGGRIRKPYREIKLRARPMDVPVDIVVDITEMDHNDAIHASDLQLPEGVTPVYDRDYVVVKVTKPRGKLLDEDGQEILPEDAPAAAEE
ncbi:MAG: large subunit ribosomal protein L25 [Bradymonadia bacterium]|jgi:large subunit ribosomal protein L25